MKKTIYMTITAFCCISLVFCSGRQIQKADDICFALIANTFPASPYSEPDVKFSTLVSEINSTPADFTIHLGNMIFSGPAEKTLNDGDITKQLTDQKKYTDRLYSRFYHVMGEYDMYLKNPDLMKKHFGPEYYSFNYGSTHLIVLNSNDTAVNFISKEQFNWLKKDMKIHRKSARFIIFLNHAARVPADNKSLRNLQTLNQENELLGITGHYSNNIIISNYGSRYFDFADESAEYVNAAVSNLTDYTRRSENDYYIISITGGKLAIEGKKLGK